MLPNICEGDRLLVAYGVRIRVGDVVVALFPDSTLVVKRATQLRALRDGSPGWWLLSDNPGEGVDSRHRGPVPRGSVHGVVLLRVWPRPGRVRRSRS